ncbi:MAG: sigma factor [Pirellulaceae bacterium]
MTPPASSHRTPAESGANDDPRSSFDSTPDQRSWRGASGESERFGELVRRYEGALRRLAISRGLTTDSADEVVQETFLAAFRYLAGYDERYGFRTWLWTILFNQCRRRQTLESRQPSRLPAEAIEWASFAGTEDPVSRGGAKRACKERSRGPCRRCPKPSPTRCDCATSVKRLIRRSHKPKGVVWQRPRIACVPD